MAVKDGHYGSWKGSSRWPRQLIVEARITWIFPTSLEVRLPQVQISNDGHTILLPSTRLRLPKFATGMLVSARHSDTEEPCEWRCQPFYSKVYGKSWTADLATFYTENIWRSYSEFFDSGISEPHNVESEPFAKILGVSSDATRGEISVAFRKRVKQVHPDRGGSSEAFQRLLKARDEMNARHAANRNERPGNGGRRHYS